MFLDFFAGCLGGCAGVIVGHPLDTVKVHIQTQNSLDPKHKSSIACFRSLVNSDGIRGIYRGISSPLLGVAAINAIIFGVYGNTQRHLTHPDALHSHFLAGATAGLCQSFFCSPMELIKTHMQIVGGKNGPLECLKGLYMREGCKGVFRGLGVTICREIPAFGTYFITYEWLTRGTTQVSTGWMLLSGGFAGVASWLITYPVDVLKTRIQADGLLGPRVYKNSLDCLRQSVKNEGYSFLMRGVTPTIIRAFPTNAACFTVVTWCIRLFDKDRDSTCREEYLGDALLNLKRAEVYQS